VHGPGTLVADGPGMRLLGLLVAFLVCGCAPEEALFQETTLDLADAKADGSRAEVLEFTPGLDWQVRMRCRELASCDVRTHVDLDTPADTLAPYARRYFAANPGAREWVVEGLLTISLMGDIDRYYGVRGAGHTRHTVRPLADGRLVVTTELVQTEGPNGALQYFDVAGTVAARFSPRDTVTATVRLQRALLEDTSDTLPVAFTAHWQ
jgi:hypothetical protein